MKEKNFLDLTSCRHCRHYQPEGRRGGSCHQLGVSVDSSWKACMLASSPFEDPLKNLDTTLTNLDTTLTTLEEIVYLETALSLSYESYSEKHAPAEKTQFKDDLISNKSRNQ